MKGIAIISGFTVDNEAIVNGTSRDYVCWGWKESTTAGFDIVSYTGTGSNQTISHGLSAALDFIIVKNRATTNQWCIYNRPRRQDYQGDLIENAIKGDIVNQAGSWFSFNNEKIAQGRENLRLLLKENNNLRLSIEEKVKSYLGYDN